MRKKTDEKAAVAIVTVTVGTILVVLITVAVKIIAALIGWSL